MQLIKEYIKEVNDSKVTESLIRTKRESDDETIRIKSHLFLNEDTRRAIDDITKEFTGEPKDLSDE